MSDPAAPARRPVILALTGSIGMGKSTTAGFFRAEGVPVWDADAAVHRLYAPGGAAVGPIAALVPAARDSAGGIDRAALRAALRDDPALLPRIEAAVHPLVAFDRETFLAAEAARGSPIVLLDIPLLFETGGERIADRIVVVTAPAEVQRARVLARPGMTEETFAAILARQMPDAEKRARAHHVIDTSRGLDAAAEAVRSILATLPKATGDT